jgi:hypothetical protein
MCVKGILAELSGIPKQDIRDTMTVRHDLGITAHDLAPLLLAEFATVDPLLLYDPAALVHDIELAVA